MINFIKMLSLMLMLHEAVCASDPALCPDSDDDGGAIISKYFSTLYIPANMPVAEQTPLPSGISTPLLSTPVDHADNKIQITLEKITPFHAGKGLALVSIEDFLAALKGKIEEEEIHLIQADLNDAFAQQVRDTSLLDRK
ncbi:MAG: hypothetical protein NTX76_04180 [Alphaproteobacteria bacterium]|nr:hypothetical protein [Alphaproteobacteria bacterium]